MVCSGGGDGGADGDTEGIRGGSTKMIMAEVLMVKRMKKDETGSWWC